MAGAQAGVVGQAEVLAPQGNPVSRQKSPAFWSWVFFIASVLIVLGFHVRIFGVTLPPSASLPG